jgi:hypothetical protein
MPDARKNPDDIVPECQKHDLGQDDDEPTASEKRSYYYDDAHGYEDFDPDERDDEED